MQDEPGISWRYGHQFAPLIAGIVQNQVYAPARQFFAKPMIDNRCGFDIISCADAVQFMRDCCA